MRKWLRNPFTLVIVTAVAVASWLVWCGASEPIYKGKRLSVWLRAYDPVFTSIGVESGEGADEALHSIGTNAMPTLFRMLQAKDSALTIKLVLLAQKQKLINFDYVDANRRNYEASEAFQVLGASASNAVPELIEIYGQNISTESQCLTANAIGYIGPAATNAISGLLRGVKTTNDPVRWNTVWALGKIHGQPELVVPELVKLLRDPVPKVSRAAFEALGDFGANAGSAVPGLIEMLNDKNRVNRELATNALRKIEPLAAAKAGVR